MAENKITTWEHDHAMQLGRFLVPPGCEPASREAVSRWVPGRPAPQGSKRYVGKSKRGKAVLIEQNKTVKPWRELVTAAFKTRPYGASVLTSYPKGVALVVMIVFVMPRPVATPKRKPTPAHTHAPDVDKLIRAVLDGVTDAGNVWADDGQVVTVHAHKRVAELGEPPGAMIHIQRAEQLIRCNHGPSGGCTVCMPGLKIHVQPAEPVCGPHCHFVHAQDMPNHEGPCISCADPQRCVSNLPPAVRESMSSFDQPSVLP